MKKAQMSEGRGRRLREYFIAALVLCGLFVWADPSSAELTAKANHDHITIGFFYHGGSVSVSGISDPDTDLVIKIVSDDGHESLRKKGKVAGVLWMNVGSLKLDHVPSLYYLRSTRKVEDILSGEERNRNVIGYEALAHHADAQGISDDKEKSRWFEEFIKFKEASQLYGVSSGNIITAEKDGKHTYYTLSDWPHQARPGNYTVTVYAVKDHKVVETAESHVLVEQVGMVKSLAGMAKDNAVLYGILSILAALGAGFGVGMVFRKGGGAH